MMYLFYRDDGPSKPCGQDCMTTSPWGRLLIVDNYEEARRVILSIENKQFMEHRKNARIERLFDDTNDPIYMNGDPVMYIRKQIG